MPLHVIAFGSVIESALISFEPISLGSGIWWYFTAPTCTVMRFIDGTSWIHSCAVILISFHLSLRYFSMIYDNIAMNVRSLLSGLRLTPSGRNSTVYNFIVLSAHSICARSLYRMWVIPCLPDNRRFDLITSQPSRLDRSIVEGKPYRYPQAIEHFN